MCNQDKYWKSEYENLRRKKKKEIEALNRKITEMTIKEAEMCDTTFELLKMLGMSEREILEYYLSKK